MDGYNGGVAAPGLLDDAHGHVEVDVLVVGAGGSGLAAAVRAAERGCSVLVAEKQAKVGGSTALSVGSITAPGTRLQRRAGIKDSTADFIADMTAFDPDLLEGDAPDLRELMAREVGATVSWLEDLGVAFVGPYPEPPHRVPRMHNVVPSSRSYIARLSDAAKKLGVRILLETEAAELVVAEGRVVGATLRGPDGERQVRARNGVVLASGDFSGNAEMRQKYLPPAAAAARPINPSANGDGHRLADRLGAQLRRMDVTFGPQLRFPVSPKPGVIDRLPTWRWLCKAEATFTQHLPPAFLRPFAKSLMIANMSPSATMFDAGAILVNRQGGRFGEGREAVQALPFQEEGKGYIVLDSRVADMFDSPPNAISTAPGIAFAYFSDYRKGRPDLVHEGADEEGLATALGCDPHILKESLASSGLRPPYWALGPVFSMLTVTEGGLAVDTELRVLDADGRPIEGLYAVGGTGQGGMLLLGHGHHIGWAMTSGRLAGERLSSGV